MPIRVSIVEDDDILAAAFADAVADDDGLIVAGIHHNAEEFLEALERDRPEVTIMDIHLPGMSGVEAIRRAKARLPEAQFVICSVHDDDEHLFEALCAGATGYLVKDAAPERIVSAIQEVHAGGSPMSPGIARRVIRTYQRQHTPSPEIQCLTERERQVLDQLAQGFRYKEIADNLKMSLDTVRTHVRNMYVKLQVRSRTDALNKLYPR